jgi:hypothetical protein
MPVAKNAAHEKSAMAATRREKAMTSHESDKLHVRVKNVARLKPHPPYQIATLIEDRLHTGVEI